MDSVTLVQIVTRGNTSDTPGDLVALRAAEIDEL
jgi:hypothetical protein